MDIVIIPILQAVVSILGFYQVIIFISIVFSWLVMLGIVDPFNGGILSKVFMITRMVTEPLFNFARRFIPTLGPLDFSPIVVILAIYIVSGILQRLIIKISMSSAFY